MNKKLKLFISKIFSVSGFFSLYWKLYKNTKFPVFTFHRILSKEEAASYYDPALVVTDTVFDEFLNYLKLRFDIITLQELGNIIRAKQATSENRNLRKCVITFDDGYRDNYLHAYPALSRKNLNATFFITAAFIGTCEWFWHEKIFSILRSCEESDARSKKRSWDSILEITGISVHERNFVKMSQQVINALKKMPSGTIEDILKDFWSLRTDVNNDKAKRVIMNWHEVREISDRGMEIGSHTLSHAILPVEDEKTVKKELDESKRIISGESGAAPLSFSYPDNSHSVSIRRMVKDAGYNLACAGGEVPADKGSDLYSIPRIDIHEGKITGLDGHFSPELFEMAIAFPGSLKRIIDNLRNLGIRGNG